MVHMQELLEHFHDAAMISRNHFTMPLDVVGSAEGYAEFSCLDFEEIGLEIDVSDLTISELSRSQRL